MIDYIKEQVGEGIEYKQRNGRVVIRIAGCYYEFLDMPEEFSGALRPAGSSTSSWATGHGLLIGRADAVHDRPQQRETPRTQPASIYDRRGLFDRGRDLHLPPLAAGATRPPGRG